MIRKKTDKKIERIIQFTMILSCGGKIYKEAEAKKFGVNERTIRRDITEIKKFMAIISRTEKVGKKRVSYYVKEETEK